MESSDRKMSSSRAEVRSKGAAGSVPWLLLESAVPGDGGCSEPSVVTVVVLSVLGPGDGEGVEAGVSLGTVVEFSREARAARDARESSERMESDGIDLCGVGERFLIGEVDWGLLGPFLM